MADPGGRGGGGGGTGGTCPPLPDDSLNIHECVLRIITARNSAAVSYSASADTCTVTGADLGGGGGGGTGGTCPPPPNSIILLYLHDVARYSSII